MSTSNKLSNETTSQSNDRQRRTGRVKWFGKGYGFVIDVDDIEKEYFVHHTALIVSEPTGEDERRVYKRLEKGEYIECSIIRDSEGRDCAIDVTGIRHGPLMCETNPSSPVRRQPQRRYNNNNRRERSTSRSISRSRSRSKSRSRRRSDTPPSRNRSRRDTHRVRSRSPSRSLSRNSRN